jgi:hypothetical protein
MKLPTLFPVAFFTGGILLSIELMNFALLSPRVVIFAAILFLLFGYIALRRNWLPAAALLAAGAWLSLGLERFRFRYIHIPKRQSSWRILRR